MGGHWGSRGRAQPPDSADRGHKDTGGRLQTLQLRISVCLPRNGSSPPACPRCPVHGCQRCPQPPASAQPRPSPVAVGSSFALCPSAPAPASQSLSPPPHHLPQFLCPAAEPRGVRLHFRLPLSFAPPHAPTLHLSLWHSPTLPSPADRRDRPKTQSEEQDGRVCVNTSAAGRPGRVW